MTKILQHTSTYVFQKSLAYITQHTIVPKICLTLYNCVPSHDVH